MQEFDFLGKAVFDFSVVVLAQQNEHVFGWIKHEDIFEYYGLFGETDNGKLVPLLGECAYLNKMFRYAGHFGDAYTVSHDGQYSIRIDGEYVVLSTNFDGVDLHTNNKTLDFAVYF